MTKIRNSIEIVSVIRKLVDWNLFGVWNLGTGILTSKFDLDDGLFSQCAEVFFKSLIEFNV